MNTQSTTLRLLVIAPAGAQLAELKETLTQYSGPTELLSVASTQGMRNALAASNWDIALYLTSASFSPQTALKVIDETGLDLPVLLLAAAGEHDSAMIAMRAGARDVIESDRLQRLLPAIEREIREIGNRAEHRAALEMLRESEARFRAMATNLPGMLFHLRRDANGDYRFLYVSEGCQKLFGRKQHELRSSSHLFFEAFGADQRHRLQDALIQSASGGSLLNWEGQTTGRSRSKWINLRSTPHIQESGVVEWHGIATNVSHSKDIESELRESREQLAELSSHLEAVKEEERERIARDIHDELGSILVRLKIEVALLGSKLPDALQLLRGKAHSIEGLLDQAMGTASRVARELRPGILKEFGLPAALECQAEDFAQRSNITCVMQCDDEAIAPDAETSLAIFRIAQEALTNVAKHAHASLVVMRLRRDSGNILFEVHDNGRGISVNDMSKAKSFGLRGIRERILSLNGEFWIEPGEQGGTYIRLSVPEHAVTELFAEEEPQRTLF
jgi:PAS domain S-box-containing protein